MRALAWLVVCAACGDNVPTTLELQRIISVSPAQGFIGHTMQVELTGDQTEWNNASTIDLGGGITVDSLTVIDQEHLRATITIGPTLDAHTRDITVSDPGALRTSFELVYPIELQLAAPPQQGAIVPYTIINRDPTAPFNGHTAVGDMVNGHTEFAIDSVTETSITGHATFGLDANASSPTVIIGPSNTPILSSAGPPIAVAPRAAIQAASPTTQTLAAPFESDLYQVTDPTWPTLVRVALDAPPTARVGLFLGYQPLGLVTTYAFAYDGYGDEALIHTYYATVVDTSGAAPVDYQLQFTATPLGTTASEGIDATNNTATGATHVPVPVAVTYASLSSNSDEDWYAIDVAATDLGKQIEVVSSSLAHPSVEVYGPGSTTLLAGPNPVANQMLTTPALAAVGTYYVRVTGSVSATSNSYGLAVLIE